MTGNRMILREGQDPPLQDCLTSGGDCHGRKRLAMTRLGRWLGENALVYVILSEVRSTQSKNLRTFDSAKILRLAALAQDDGESDDFTGGS